jgi:4-hydroxybenzoate polyprenyltransferase
MQTSEHGGVADAARGNWVDRMAPDWLKPFAQLARWDRPIGAWLLFWPCGWGLGLAAVAFPERGFGWLALLLCLVGAVMMRGAGCTFNDIVDRDIDAKVARTRSRPIPSGRVTPWHALLFMLGQSLVGLLVLLQFNPSTIWLGVVSLLPVAIYPFMKRITWWPQAFLGIAFSWGALVGWTATAGALAAPAIVLYAGAILWVIGYDTIYALQDAEDDALVGVRSTALLFGEKARLAIAGFYAVAVVLWVLAGLLAGAGPVLLLGLVPAAGLLAWQVLGLKPGEPADALMRFKSNSWVGVILTLALLAEAML